MFAWVGDMFNAIAQRPQILFTFLFFAGVFALLWANKMPSIQGVIDCANVLNSKGGNLLLLAIMSGWFFYEALKFAYHLLYMTSHSEITPDNAIALSMFSFVTGTAFGGAFGALLKGMSGESVTATSGASVETKKTETETVVSPPVSSIQPEAGKPIQ